MKDFWNSLSIRYKIIFTIILIILMVTFTIIPAVSYLIKDALLLQQQSHLVSVKNLVMKLFEDYRSKVSNYTKLFSNDREVKDTLFYHTELAGEREHPLRAAERLYKSFDVSSVEIVDAKGITVASAKNPDAHGKDKSSDALIKTALGGSSASGITITEDGFVITASAPIDYNEGQIIGAITAGIAINDVLLKRIKELTGTDLALADRQGRIFSATVKNTDALKKNNDENIVQGFPISDLHDSEIGSVIIVQENRLPKIIGRAHITLLALLAAIGGLSVSVLYITLKRLTEPILRLKDGAERIGKGEFGYRIDIDSKDEIGELSDAFNKMTGNLEKLHEVEEKLRHSEKLAAVGRFASGIAHEINNPIANINGIARLMLKNSDAAQKEDLETIINNAGRCAKITRDLLTYSRQSPPIKEKASISAVVDEAVSGIAQHMNSKKIKIIKNIPDTLPDLNIDMLQIGQVVGNLLLNAVQAIDKNGEINITAARVGSNSVDITISDNGCGIDDEIKDRIFDPFFTTKAVNEGTGLGLAISYGIVQNHGGEIFVESQKGHGSKFMVRLPI